MKMSAELVMTICGWSAFVVTIYWVRDRELREKYAMAWLSMAAYFLVLGTFPQIIKSFAEWANMAYATAALLFMVPPLYAFCFANNVSQSRQFRRNQRLMQELALLQRRVRQLESQRPEPPGTNGGRNGNGQSLPRTVEPTAEVAGNGPRS